MNREDAVALLLLLSIAVTSFIAGAAWFYHGHNAGLETYILTNCKEETVVCARLKARYEFGESNDWWLDALEGCNAD